MRIHAVIWSVVATLLATASALAANLTVDGSQRFQRVDGMGVNINVNSWNDGQLSPALNMLIGPTGSADGATIVRVVRDPMTWVADSADIAPLRALDAATLVRIYETPAMQDIWNTIEYLNYKGLKGSQIMLNFMGWTPVWLGGSGAYGNPSYITPGMEPALATMIASLIYYGRNERGLDFTLLGPLNESDWNCLEGPCVSPEQYAVVLHALVEQLDEMRLTDVRLVGPDTADPSRADAYISELMADSVVAARTDHFGLHVYGSSQGPRTPYAGRDYWLTETSADCGHCSEGLPPAQGEWAFASESGDDILGSLRDGISGVLVWDAFDSFYYHHNSLGVTGLLAFDQGTMTYSPRKRFYVNAQINGFIGRGAVRISEAHSLSGLGTTVAFIDSAAGTVSIIGHNTSASPITISGALVNVPAIPSFSQYVTDGGAMNLQRGADVPITGGAFVDTIPPDAFFSLTSAPDRTPPTIGTISARAGDDATATITWLTNERSTSRVDYGAAPSALTLSVSNSSLVTAHSLVLSGLTGNTTYYYRVTSADSWANGATAPPLPAPPLSFRARGSPANSPPVAVATASPRSGATPLLVSFSGAASTDADGDSLSFAWTFGDGTTGAGRLASHNYSGTGVFLAILTVADGRGGTDTASVTISTQQFPRTSVLDHFDRPDGPIGGSWVDDTSGFSISSDQLAPSAATSYIEWGGSVYDANQEAFVTLSAITATGAEHNLMLKTQGTVWESGHIEVSYDPSNSMVLVNTFTPPSTWSHVGTIPGVSLATGDQFGARALDDGTVQVYKNGLQVGSVSVAGWPYAALGGRIGLSCSGASTSRFEDFGGGTVPSSVTGFESPPVERRLFLSPALPNPTHAGVTLSLALPEEADVSLDVLDVQGREVWRAPTRHLGPGHWSLAWDGRTERGPARTGLYLAQVRVGARVLMRRVVVVR